MNIFMSEKLKLDKFTLMVTHNIMQSWCVYRNIIVLDSVQWTTLYKPQGHILTCKPIRINGMKRFESHPIRR